MAKLFINKDIVADSEKYLNWCLTGDDGMSFSDIQCFMDWMDPNDGKIEVEIHSCGGDCVEGYAIYDALRASGKEISCKVVGKCASMATVVLLAAPLERRTMYEHAQMLIHSPYYPDGIGGALTSEKLQSLAAELTKEKDKMVNLYVERTGQTAEALEAQMATDAWFDVNKAIELGFISSVVPAISAKAKNNINPKTEKMNKEKKVTVASSLMDRLLKRCGYAKIEDVPAVGLVLTTSTGDELNVEREEGEIQVGDPASPDGEHVLEDGRTVVVTDGVITEIREAEDGGDTAALEARIAELEQQVSELTSQAKTAEENEIISFVAKAGGLEKLKKAASSYVPTGRTTTAGKRAEVKTESKIGKKLAEIREKNKKKYNY